MREIPSDPRERHRLWKAIDEAFKTGSFEHLGNALGGSPTWINEQMPSELGLGRPLEYAIYWSPVVFVAELIEAGADPNYVDDAGFPSIIAALSTTRADRLQIVRLLVNRGADLGMRGLNDWTPLHYAASTGDVEAVRILLSLGSDPQLRTRIDDCATALEEAERGGFREAAAVLRDAITAR